jgi:aldehyde dehydrogenase (NAD+)
MSTQTITAAEALYERNYIDGAFRPPAGGETYERHNPARTSEVVGTFPRSGPEDLEAAVSAAHAAFAAWSRTPAAARGAILQRAADILAARSESVAQDMTREMGKPLREARMEAARMSAILRFFAGEGWRAIGERFEQAATGATVYTDRRPLGVVALITPWNFPAAIPAWKAAPALAYGNTVVLKPAEDSPLTALHLAAALDEAGLPAGVLNVVIGKGSRIGTPLVTHSAVRAVSFTGSVAVGALVRDEATRRGRRVQLELGGHNPLIVMADADLDRAVEAAYAGAFWSAGQKCTATRRILVQRPAYDAFRDLLLARVARGRVGDPADPDTEVGPIVNESQMTEVLDAIARGVEQGGTLLTGGERIGTDGYLVSPAVFENVAADAYLACEEVFGPVTTLAAFGELDEAIDEANRLDFGLSASIYTSSLEASSRFSREVQAGLLHVNSQTAGADIHVPFGGLKGSSFGPHEQGRAAIEFYTEQVTVYHDV